MSSKSIVEFGIDINMYRRHKTPSLSTQPSGFARVHIAGMQRLLAEQDARVASLERQLKEADKCHAKILAAKDETIEVLRTTLQTLTSGASDPRCPPQIP